MAPRGRPKKRLSRMDAAVDAMAPLGFDERLVKKTVNKLLKLYGGDESWKFIAEYGYNVLLEALLSDQDEQQPQTQMNPLPIFSPHFWCLVASFHVLSPVPLLLEKMFPRSVKSISLKSISVDLNAYLSCPNLPNLRLIGTSKRQEYVHHAGQNPHEGISSLDERQEDPALDSTIGPSGTIVDSTCNEQSAIGPPSGALVISTCNEADNTVGETACSEPVNAVGEPTHEELCSNKQDIGSSGLGPSQSGTSLQAQRRRENNKQQELGNQLKSLLTGVRSGKVLPSWKDDLLHYRMICMAFLVDL